MQDSRREWLRPKMDELFEKKSLLETRGKDFNTIIQAGREYRNPRIGEKLIEVYNIKQYGTNLPKDQHDPDRWHRKPEAFYDSSMYRKLAKDREAQKQSSSSSSKQKSRDL